MMGFAFKQIVVQDPIIEPIISVITNTKKALWIPVLPLRRLKVGLAKLKKDQARSDTIFPA